MGEKMPSKPSRASEKSVHPSRPLNTQGGPVHKNLPFLTSAERAAGSSSAESHDSVAPPPPAVGTPTVNRQSRDDLPPIYAPVRSGTRKDKRTSETTGPMPKKQKTARSSDTNTSITKVKRPTIGTSTPRTDDDPDVIVLGSRSGSKTVYDGDEEEEEAPEPIEWNKASSSRGPSDNGSFGLISSSAGPSSKAITNPKVQDKRPDLAHRASLSTETEKANVPPRHTNSIAGPSSSRSWSTREAVPKRTDSAHSNPPPTETENEHVSSLSNSSAGPSSRKSVSNLDGHPSNLDSARQTHSATTTVDGSNITIEQLEYLQNVLTTEHFQRFLSLGPDMAHQTAPLAQNRNTNTLEGDSAPKRKPSLGTDKPNEPVDVEEIAVKLLRDMFQKNRAASQKSTSGEQSREARPPKRPFDPADLNRMSLLAWKKAEEKLEKDARLKAGIPVDILLAERIEEEDPDHQRYGSPYLYLESPAYSFESSTDGGATWFPCEQWEADDIMIEIRGEDGELLAAPLLRFVLDRSTSYIWWKPYCEQSITLSMSEPKLFAKINLFDTDGRWLISSEEPQDVIMSNGFLRLNLRKALGRSWFVDHFDRPTNHVEPPVGEPSPSPPQNIESPPATDTIDLSHENDPRDRNRSPNLTESAPIPDKSPIEAHHHALSLSPPPVIERPPVLEPPPVPDTNCDWSPALTESTSIPDDTPIEAQRHAPSPSLPPMINPPAVIDTIDHSHENVQFDRDHTPNLTGSTLIPDEDSFVDHLNLDARTLLTIPWRRIGNRHARRLAFQAQLLNALDKIYDGGTNRHDMRDQEEDNILPTLHIAEEHLVIACTWTRMTYQYGPMYFTDQEPYLLQYIRQYGDIISEHLAGNALKLHFTRLFQDGRLRPPLRHEGDGPKEALRVLIAVNRAWNNR